LTLIHDRGDEKYFKCNVTLYYRAPERNQHTHNP